MPIQPRQTITRRLPCSLTDEERTEAAMTAALLSERYDRKEDAKKDIVKCLTDELKTLRGELSRNSHKAATGTENRAIECAWTIDRERALATLCRTDTGELIETRELTTAETQLTMDALVQALMERSETYQEPTTDQDEDGQE